MYRSAWPITIIDMEGMYGTNILQDWVSIGQDNYSIVFKCYWNLVSAIVEN